MTFTSSACTLEWNRNNLTLRRGDSVLMIESNHVTQLRTLKSDIDFTEFFKNTALQNREARRVFQAWERKDTALLQKIFKEMSE